MDPEKTKRTELLLGTRAVERLAQSSVTVLGLGAVGSHVIEALARTGVGTLRIVDVDVISPSNFNRQLLAVEATLGRLKTAAAEDRLRQINPDIQVETFNTFCHGDTFDEIFSSPTDVVVDAIDSLNPKVNVLYRLVRRNMAVVSCMGAARRVDPSQIRVGDISQTQACPLARSVRKRLKRMGIDQGIRCVYSTEIAPEDSVSRVPEAEGQNTGRPRNPMGSIVMITGIFGYMAALEALRILVPLTGPAIPVPGAEENDTP